MLDSILAGTLLGSLFLPQTGSPCDRYTVTLTRVYTNKPVSGDMGDSIRLIRNDKVQLDESAANADKKDYWNIGTNESRHVEVMCLNSQSLGASCVLRLEAALEDGNFHIGTVKTTLVREDGEVRLVFEQDKGNRIYRGRRAARIDGQTFWLTRVFPENRSANYVLYFRIDKDPE